MAAAANRTMRMDIFMGLGAAVFGCRLIPLRKYFAWSVFFYGNEISQLKAVLLGYFLGLKANG